MGELVIGVDAVHVGLQRDRDAVGVVPELLGEDLARGLHADDPEAHALDGDVAAHGIGPAEELGTERAAHDRHRRAAAFVVVGQAAAHRDVAVHPAAVVGPHAVDPAPLGAARDLDGRHRRRAGQEREHAFVGSGDARQVLAAQARAHREPLLFLGRRRRLGREHDRAVPAHSREAHRDLVHDAVHDRSHDDEREDAERQERERQKRAQLVRPELDEAALDDLPAERQLGAGGEAPARPAFRGRRHRGNRRRRDRVTHSAAPPSARGAKPSTPGRARTGSRRRRRARMPRRSSSRRCGAGCRSRT